eukprot:TRINITY_DN6653_c0_g5_i1.p1 TRINITY_DN6653_c0_g5~~TRINITY_DN6653_c0_g5_i1.p1  ORF type:complete len:1096 (-),score=170.72 TRINITY_DN6653_c0_g5_i1:105-3242(-)
MDARSFQNAAGLKGAAGNHASSSSSHAPSPAAAAAGDAVASASVSLAEQETCLPGRFFQLTQDIVVQEIATLQQPWDVSAIDERIRKYSACSETVNARLSDGVRRNYGEFVRGMQQVEAVEAELTTIGVLVKNGRRTLRQSDAKLVRGGLCVARRRQKSERLKALLSTMEEFQAIVRVDARLRECLQTESYCEALTLHDALRAELADSRIRQFPSLLSLREGLGLHLDFIRQKLSDGLRVAAVSADFESERYAEILKAYSLMSPHQTVSVGKELLQHVYECIVSVSRQCMLAFSVPPSNESPALWHQKAQLADLCRSMDPQRFVQCTAQLYEYLCDFLYRHQFLCAWHANRLQEEESGGANGGAANGESANGGTVCSPPRLRQLLRDVLNELVASKRNLWDRIQQQVSLVLMTSDMQFPRLREEGFLHVLNLTQLLIEEGDLFAVDAQSSRVGGAPETRRWSAPIRNTLKSKAHDYFYSMHYSVWTSFKLAYIEQDSWQRLPVPRNHRLLRADRLRAQLPQRSQAPAGTGASTASSATASKGGPSDSKLRTAENNPFRNYKAESTLPASRCPPPEDEVAEGPGAEERAAIDEVDDHALLQHWINDSEGFSLERIGSTMLSNSNRSPVVSSSTVELARMLERYFRMMGAMPQLASDIFQAAAQLIEFYVHCVLSLFVQEKHVSMLLEELDVPPAPPAPGDTRLYQRHEALLVQKLCPELRRAAVRTRELLLSTTLPESCAASLNVQAASASAALLYVQPLSKLTAPPEFCGVAERCVGVESVKALLGDLREVQQVLVGMLPKSDGKETLERFLPTQELISSQLRTFVLSCAARDILEIPDVGRVSLDAFCTAVQGLRWDAKDFSHGSPAAPYLEQLRAQLDELSRRLPCAGGGSIPHATQTCVWSWMEVRVMHECVELVARLGRRKSQEALFCLAEDFQSLRKAMGKSFGTSDAEEASEAGTSLLPVDHPLASTVRWTYVDQYLQAHGGLPGEALPWCRQHTEYPLRLHRALLEFFHGNPKAQKQFVGDLENFYANYVVDEASRQS